MKTILSVSGYQFLLHSKANAQAIISAFQSATVVEPSHEGNQLIYRPVSKYTPRVEITLIPDKDYIPIEAGEVEIVPP